MAHARSLPLVIVFSVLRCAGPAYAAAGASPAPFRVEPIPGHAELDTIEIHGVGAGSFSPAIWQAGTLHFQPDVRCPLLAPRVSGVFRNIYAPSAVRVPDGWRVFYGAWDGVATGNDRIYSTFTRDFLDFGERRTEIEHGDFIHVCNVNAIRLDDGGFRMICTAYPDADGLNKPAFFTSLDGTRWNDTPAPYAARRSDLVRVEGYAPYAAADINGVNVILHENGRYRLYFNNWKDPGKVYRASGEDGRHYRFEGVSLPSSHAVNDVRRFASGGTPWYLMGLHMNTNRLWYALSRDGMRFEPERELAAQLGAQDRYIVALGWVTDNGRLLGFLYGAGAVPELNRNRIFARWLQKRVVLVNDQGARMEPAGALGPDRQVIHLRGAKPFDARWEVFAEDGRTPLGQPTRLKVAAGGVYRIALPE